MLKSFMISRSALGQAKNFGLFIMTAVLTEPRLFQTGSIALPASRFLCEHLRQKVFFGACISRIHAHHAMRDSHQGRLHLCAETDVVVSRGIAREGHEGRSQRRNSTCAAERPARNASNRAARNDSSRRGRSLHGELR
jgi:hypothetical protein